MNRLYLWFTSIKVFSQVPAIDCFLSRFGDPETGHFIAKGAMGMRGRFRRPRIPMTCAYVIDGRGLITP
jgi:hypothetical protein